MKSKLEKFKIMSDLIFNIKSDEYSFCFHNHYGSKIVYSVWRYNFDHKHACLIGEDNGSMKILDNQFGYYESGIELYKIRQIFNEHFFKMERLLNDKKFHEN